MKKLLIIVFLFISVAALSQPTNYTNFLSRNRYIALMADSTLHAPAGSSTSFRTGGSRRAGAIFVDSVGTDSGFYYSGTGFSWHRLARYSEIASAIDTTTMATRARAIKVADSMAIKHSIFYNNGTIDEDRTLSGNDLYDFTIEQMTSINLNTTSSLGHIIITTGGDLRLQGHTEFTSGSIDLEAIIAPSQIISDQNDYAPTGANTSVVFRLSSDASRNITGIANGAGGRIIIIHNVGSNNIVLKDESASSLAAARFALTGDLTLAPDNAIMLQYDATAGRWRALGSIGSGGGAGTVTDFVFTDGSGFDGTVTNSTTTPTLSLTTTVADTRVMYSSSGAITGSAALTFAPSGNMLFLTSQNATDIPFTIRSHASQSGNLQVWEQSDGTDLTVLTKDGYMHLPLGTTSNPALKLGSGTSGLSGSSAGGIWFFTNTGAWTHMRDGNIEFYPNSTSNFISRGGSSVSAAISGRLYFFDSFNYEFGEDGASVSDQTIQAADGSGTNDDGANLIIQSGGATGNNDDASSADILLQTSDATTSGTSAQTFSTKLNVGKAGYITGYNRSVTFAIGGTVHVDVTDVGNVGSGADDLMSYTVPANTLINDGDALEVEMAFRTASNLDAKQVRVYFGGTLLIELDDFVSLGDEHITVSLTILRTGSATQDYWGEIHYRKGSTRYSKAFHGTLTVTLSSSAVLKGVGEGVSNDDVVQKISHVKYLPYKF